MEVSRLADVATALGIGASERHVVALVGGGGKTTLAHALADQLWAASRRPTIITTTTKMGADQGRGKPVLDRADGETGLAENLRRGPILVAERTEGPKLIGVAPDVCDRWFASGLVDHLVIEADGARRRPFKAPRHDEPVVPRTCEHLVSVIGAHALGRVIADQCHRPLRVAALAGCSPYVRLSPEAAADVLLHERGARKELPSGGQLSIVINQVSDLNHQDAVDLGQLLTRRAPEVTTVLVGLEPLSAGNPPQGGPPQQ